jgi:HPt (histidine-containing phosphotransfer) domain-containing protein/molybdenum-dependent DNA-binding transcriptional regulator ModE
MVGSEPERVIRFARKFLETAEVTLREMENAIKTGSTEELSRLGHSLKSSARTVGAMEMADISLKIEALGNEEKHPEITQKEMKALVCQLQEAYSRAHSAITRMVESLEEERLQADNTALAELPSRALQVLVVDDEEFQLQHIRTVLEDLNIRNILTAGRGKEALCHLLRGEPARPHHLRPADALDGRRRAAAQARQCALWWRRYPAERCRAEPAEGRSAARTADGIEAACDFTETAEKVTAAIHCGRNLAMKNINPKYFRAFKAVVSCNSFSHAAAKAYMTQANISKHIQALEEQVGHQLFIRTNKNPVITEAGKSLLKYIERLDELNAELAYEITGNQQSLKGAVRYGLPYTALFNSQFARLREKWPGAARPGDDRRH